MSVEKIEAVKWKEIVREELEADRAYLLDESIPVEKKYDEFLLEYKDEARKAISERLGFEPTLEVSMEYECDYRFDLKLHYNGFRDEDDLETEVWSYVRKMRELIENSFPEQHKLLLKHDKKVRIKENEEFQERYKKENIEYQKEAQKLIIEELGYDVPLEAIKAPELRTRHYLKRLNDGLMSKTEFNKQLKITGQATNTGIWHRFPELKECADKYSAENPW